jgi:hypothetical protein
MQVWDLNPAKQFDILTDVSCDFSEPLKKVTGCF